MFRFDYNFKLILLSSFTDSKLLLNPCLLSYIKLFSFFCSLGVEKLENFLRWMGIMGGGGRGFGFKMEGLFFVLNSFFGGARRNLTLVYNECFL